ncbi:MAG: polysaccharide biosynthesis C-terminal domain-containing protein [Bacteroidia bacterium]
MLYGLFVPLRDNLVMLDAMGKPKVNFAIVMLSALLNILFNYIFISRWGLDLSSFYGTLITYLIILSLIRLSFFRNSGYSLNTLYYAYKVYRNGFALLIKKLKDFLKL